MKVSVKQKMFFTPLRVNMKHLSCIENIFTSLLIPVLLMFPAVPLEVSGAWFSDPRVYFTACLLT